MDDMTRDESWQFLPMGRRLERLAHLARMISHVLTMPGTDWLESLEWLLEAANSIVTFRARYRRAPELLPVLHLIVLDGTNPHSVAFQLRELAVALVRTHAELGGEPTGDEILGPSSRPFATCRSRGSSPSEGKSSSRLCHLASLRDRSERLAYGVGPDLQRRFFTHTGLGAAK